MDIDCSADTDADTDANTDANTDDNANTPTAGVRIVERRSNTRKKRKRRFYKTLTLLF